MFDEYHVAQSRSSRAVRIKVFVFQAIQFEQFADEELAAAAEAAAAAASTELDGTDYSCLTADEVLDADDGSGDGDTYGDDDDAPADVAEINALFADYCNGGHAASYHSGLVEELDPSVEARCVVLRRDGLQVHVCMGKRLGLQEYMLSGLLARRTAHVARVPWRLRYPQRHACLCFKFANARVMHASACTPALPLWLLLMRAPGLFMRCAPAAAAASLSMGTMATTRQRTAACRPLSLQGISTRRRECQCGMALVVTAACKHACQLAVG